MIAFVSPFAARAKFGGSMVSELIEDQLRLIDTVHAFRVAQSDPPSGALNRVRRELNKYVDWSGNAARQHVDRAMDEGCRVFVIDTLNMAWLAAHLRRRMPCAFIVVISHNDEIAYWSSRREFPSWVRRLAISRLRRAEQLAHRYANVITHMTPFDRAGVLQRLATSNEEAAMAAHICMPVAVEAVSPGITTDTDATSGNAPGRRAGWIFVGSNFFANRMTLPKLDELARRSGESIRVIGSVCDSSEAKAASNLQMLGKVEDLGAAYAACEGAIAMVDDGSGMKVKVAEALAHGVPVLATEASARGYEAAVDAGVVHVTDWADAPQALRALRNHATSATRCQDVHAAHYSPDALGRNLRAVIAHR